MEQEQKWIKAIQRRNSRAAAWLTAIPTVVFCLLAAAGITMYLLELRRFCRRPMEGGLSYALR